MLNANNIFVIKKYIFFLFSVWITDVPRDIIELGFFFLGNVDLIFVCIADNKQFREWLLFIYKKCFCLFCLWGRAHVKFINTRSFLYNQWFLGNSKNFIGKSWERSYLIFIIHQRNKIPLNHFSVRNPQNPFFLGGIYHLLNLIRKSIKSNNWSSN